MVNGPQEVQHALHLLRIKFWTSLCFYFELVDKKKKKKKPTFNINGIDVDEDYTVVFNRSEHFFIYKNMEFVFVLTMTVRDVAALSI